MFKRLSRAVNALERLAAAADDFVSLYYELNGMERQLPIREPEKSTAGFEVATNERIADLEQRDQRSYGSDRIRPDRPDAD